MKCERVQEIDYIKFKESSDYTIDYEEIKCFELVNDEKVEYCTIIEDQEVESYVEIIESFEIIEDKEDNNNLIEDNVAENDVYKLIESCELIEDQEDINELIFNETVEITFNESPFKSLISDIRSILPKYGHSKLKKCLKYIRELRKSTTLEIKNIKNELIKIKNKRINRNKKEVRDYYQETKFYRVKDIRNLFDDDDDDDDDDDNDDDDDDIYEGIKYLFDEKIMYYYFKQKEDEKIKHQKVEDIKMPKSSKNEFDKIKELGLTMEELKLIARKIGIKNYENLSRIELVKEIDKLEPPKESKKKKNY